MAQELSEDRYFHTLSEEDIWRRYCGFMDLSISSFMDVQKETLMDEIERVYTSALGKKIIGEKKPQSVEEFRHIVPITSYEDYEPFLSEKQEDALAIKPLFWCHSSGRGGKFKWIPHSDEFVHKIYKVLLGIFILGTATKRGEVNISPGLRLLSILPPAPYASGCLFQHFPKNFYARINPPLEDSEKLGFEDRISLGFKTALRDGVDVIGTMGSILVRIGEQFERQSKKMQFTWSMLYPMVTYRLLRAYLISKKEHRAILPKDLWAPKAVFGSGTDMTIYKDKITHYWGKVPYEAYGCVETYFLAIEGWNRSGMVFLPDIAFWEFIPYTEKKEPKIDQNNQPVTVLYDELEEGKLYEVVITQSCGMPLMRYRMKDLIKVVSLKDEKEGVYLPHIVFQRRVDAVITLAGLCQLDEKTIWRAINNISIKYVDWTAAKEYSTNQTYLHIYIELKEDKEAAVLESLIDQELKLVDTDYKDVEEYLSVNPVKVTLLSAGSYQMYINTKIKEGVDLAHLKPMHINPPEVVLNALLECDRSIRR